jgi:uncharacterized protein YjbJ (UPF0337 family)
MSGTLRLSGIYTPNKGGIQEMAIINQDEIKGKLQQGKGKIKDKVGEMTGNLRMEREGEAENAEGHTRESWGKFKRGVSNAVDSVGDALNDAADKINR